MIKGQVNTERGRQRQRRVEGDARTSVVLFLGAHCQKSATAHRFSTRNLNIYSVALSWAGTNFPKHHCRCLQLHGRSTAVTVKHDATETHLSPHSAAGAGKMSRSSKNVQLQPVALIGCHSLVAPLNTSLSLETR